MSKRCKTARSCQKAQPAIAERYIKYDCRFRELFVHETQHLTRSARQAVHENRLRRVSTITFQIPSSRTGCFCALTCIPFLACPCPTEHGIGIELAVCLRPVLGLNANQMKFRFLKWLWFLAVGCILPSAFVTAFTLRNDVIRVSILSAAVVSTFGYVLTLKLIPVTMTYTMKAGLFGTDLNKQGSRAASKKVPESVGLVSGVVFLVSDFCYFGAFCKASI